MNDKYREDTSAHGWSSHTDGSSTATAEPVDRRWFEDALRAQGFLVEAPSLEDDAWREPPSVEPLAVDADLGDASLPVGTYPAEPEPASFEWRGPEAGPQAAVVPSIAEVASEAAIAPLTAEVGPESLVVSAEPRQAIGAGLAPLTAEAGSDMQPWDIEPAPPSAVAPVSSAAWPVIGETPARVAATPVVVAAPAAIASRDATARGTDDARHAASPGADWSARCAPVPGAPAGETPAAPSAPVTTPTPVAPSAPVTIADPGRAERTGDHADPGRAGLIHGRCR